MMLRCVIMRGGTSRAVFFRESDLPSDPAVREDVLVRVIGSPDKRQIDGLGGAEMSASKVAIVRPSAQPDADVDYIYGSVMQTEPKIDMSTVSGNISTAVGPFAIDEGLVRINEPLTKVRIYCPANKRYLISEVEVRDGRTRYDGGYTLAGLPRTGAKIKVDFANFGGGVTGSILPTGNVRDVITVPGLGEIEVSIVDAGNVGVFVNSKDVGLTGAEAPTEIEGNSDLVQKLESLRRVAAERSGLGQMWKSVKAPINPVLVLVRSPLDRENYQSGELIPAETMNVHATEWLWRIHKVLSGSIIISTGVAARIKGSVVNEVFSETDPGSPEVLLGVPSGIIPVEISLSEENGTVEILRAAMLRTARRIMEGYVYV